MANQSDEMSRTKAQTAMTEGNEKKRKSKKNVHSTDYKLSLNHHKFKSFTPILVQDKNMKVIPKNSPEAAYEYIA